jgi:hypothetical protein
MILFANRMFISVDDFNQVLELSVTDWFVIYHYSSIAVVYTLPKLSKNGEGLNRIVYPFVVAFRKN